MTAPIPSDFWGRIRQMIVDEVAKFFRSGPLRNASISDGGLTIRGGFLRLLASVTDVPIFYVGPVNPAGPDGTPQQGIIVRRADGTTVLDLRDAIPGNDGGLFNQALNWRDRDGYVVVADDTDSGQGLARPYIPAAFYPARNTDWLATTSGTFEAIYRAEVPKQHPRLRVAAYIAVDAGTTGEITVTVEGGTFGTPVTVAGGGGGFIQPVVFGPAFLADLEHMSTLHIEVQARRTSGAGLVRVAPIMAQGMQS